MINASLIGNLLIYLILVTEGVEEITIHLAMLLAINLFTVWRFVKLPGDSSGGKIKLMRRFYFGSWGLVSIWFLFTDAVPVGFNSVYSANILITLLIVFANYYQVTRKAQESADSKREVIIGTIILFFVTAVGRIWNDLGTASLLITFIGYTAYKRMNVLRKGAFLVQHIKYLVVLGIFFGGIVAAIQMVLYPVGNALASLNDWGPLASLEEPPSEESSWETNPPTSNQILFRVPIKGPISQTASRLYFKHGTYATYQNNLWMNDSAIVEVNSGDRLLESMNYQYEQLLVQLEEMAPEGDLAPILSKPDAENKTGEMIIASSLKGVTPIGAKSVKSQGEVTYQGDGIIEGSNMSIQFEVMNEAVPSKEMALIQYLNEERYEGLLEAIREQNPDAYTTIQKQNGLINVEQIKKDYLQLPNNIDPRIKVLAEEITKDDVSDYDKAKSIERYLAEGDFRYVMGARQVEMGGDAVSFFLFDTKEGICQQFAASMVLLSRSVGLPARYVVGFTSNEYHDETNELIVRERNAHAFVEVYIQGVGWVMFEPTTANTSFSLDAEGLDMESMLTVIMGALVIGGVYYIIREIVIVSAILLKDDKKAATLVKNKMERHMSFHYGTVQKGETLSEYSNRIKIATEGNITIDSIIDVYYGVIYGNEGFKREQRKELLRYCYKIMAQAFFYEMNLKKLYLKPSHK